MPIKISLKKVFYLKEKQTTLLKYFTDALRK